MRDHHDFVNTIQEGTRMVAETFDSSDDDWEPVLFLQTSEGHVNVIAVGEAFGGADERDRFAHEILPALIREHRARRIGLVVSAWKAVLSGSEARAFAAGEGAVPPSERPDRQEIVGISVIDPERAELYEAPIIRHDDAPPELGNYRLAGGPASGRFVDGARSAFE